MDQNEIVQILDNLRKLPTENEIAEFKEAKSNFDLDSLKKELADQTTNRITFIEIYEINFKKLIFEYIAKQGKTRRKAIDKLIMPKLSNVLSDKQKKDKVTNFLSALRKNEKIISAGYGIWEIKRVLHVFV